MNIPNEIHKFVKNCDLTDRELRNMQTATLLKISESLEILAGKYSDDLADYVEQELLEDIMETSGLLEVDDCDLDKQLMKQRIIEKIIGDDEEY
jgi:hypothetical protein